MSHELKNIRERWIWVGEYKRKGIVNHKYDWYQFCYTIWVIKENEMKDIQDDRKWIKEYNKSVMNWVIGRWIRKQWMNK